MRRLATIFFVVMPIITVLSCGGFWESTGGTKVLVPLSRSLDSIGSCFIAEVTIGKRCEPATSKYQRRWIDESRETLIRVLNEKGLLYATSVLSAQTPYMLTVCLYSGGALYTTEKAHWGSRKGESYYRDVQYGSYQIIVFHLVNSQTGEVLFKTRVKSIAGRNASMNIHIINAVATFAQQLRKAVEESSK